MVKEVNYNIPINNTNNTSTISIKGYPVTPALFGFGDNAWTGERCELKLHF